MTKKKFTLIELIVVITIIIILASIAALKLRDRIKNSQDSARISDINIISNALQQYLIKYSYLPLPDKNINISYNNNTIGYQGKIGENIAKAINLSNIPTDPKTDDFYDYGINYNKTKYQIVARLNNNKKFNTNQGTILKNYYSTPNKVGIIFNTDNTNITSIGDLSGNTNLYNIIFSQFTSFDNISGDKIGIEKILIQPELHNIQTNIALSLNFENGNYKEVYDLSSYYNTGYLSGTIKPQYAGGIEGYGLNFFGNSILEIKDGNSVDITNGSINFRINISQLPSNNINIIDKGNNYKIILTNGGNIECNINGTTIQSTTTLSPGNWYMITCIIGSIGKLYINGNLENQASTSPLTNTNSILIGSGLNGIIDNILITNDIILDNNDLNLLYNN